MRRRKNLREVLETRSMIQRVILAAHKKIVADNDQVPSEKNNYQETENSIIVPPRCSAKSKMAGSLDRVLAAIGNIDPGLDKIDCD